MSRLGLKMPFCLLDLMCCVKSPAANAHGEAPVPSAPTQLLRMVATMEPSMQQFVSDYSSMQRVRGKKAMGEPFLWRHSVLGCYRRGQQTSSSATMAAASLASEVGQRGALESQWRSSSIISAPFSERATVWWSAVPTDSK